MQGSPHCPLMLAPSPGKSSAFSPDLTLVFKLILIKFPNLFAEDYSFCWYLKCWGSYCVQDMSTKYIWVLKHLSSNLENLEMFSNFVERNFFFCETPPVHITYSLTQATFRTKVSRTSTINYTWICVLRGGLWMQHCRVLDTTQVQQDCTPLRRLKRAGNSEGE